MGYGSQGNPRSRRDFHVSKTIVKICDLRSRGNCPLAEHSTISFIIILSTFNPNCNSTQRYRVHSYKSACTSFIIAPWNFSSYSLLFFVSRTVLYQLPSAKVSPVDAIMAFRIISCNQFFWSGLSHLSHLSLVYPSNFWVWWVVCSLCESDGRGSCIADKGG